MLHRPTFPSLLAVPGMRFKVLTACVLLALLSSLGSPWHAELTSSLLCSCSFCRVGCRRGVDRHGELYPWEDDSAGALGAPWGAVRAVFTSVFSCCMQLPVVLWGFCLSCCLTRPHHPNPPGGACILVLLEKRKKMCATIFLFALLALLLSLCAVFHGGGNPLAGRPHLGSARQEILCPAV